MVGVTQFVVDVCSSFSHSGLVGCFVSTIVWELNCEASCPVPVHVRCGTVVLRQSGTDGTL